MFSKANYFLISFFSVLLFERPTLAACVANVLTKSSTSVVTIDGASSAECKVIEDTLAAKGTFPDIASAEVNGMAALYAFRQAKDLCTSQGGKLISNGMGCACEDLQTGSAGTQQLNVFVVQDDLASLSSELQQIGCTGGAKTAAVEPGAGSGEPPECTPQVPNLADLRNADSNECVTEEKSAEEMCDDTARDTQLGQQGDWSKGLAGIGQLGAAASCTQFAEAMKAANAGLAAFKANCSRSITSCSQTCNSRKSEITAAIDQIKTKTYGNGKSCTDSDQYRQLADSLNKVPASISRCSSRQSAVAAADQHMQVAMASQMQGSQCSNSFSSGAASLCANNPTFPGCQAESLSAGVDCAKNPTARECVCKSNPNDPYCLAAAGKINPNAGQSANGSGTFGSASASSSDAGSGSEFGDGTGGFPGLDPNGIPKGAGGLAGGGQSGGGGGGGMLSAGQLGQTRDRKGRTSGRPNIQYDLSTGGFKPKNPGGGVFGSHPGDRNAVVIGPDGKIQKVDVNKWRPGMGARGLAGIVGEDGVHCETCGDIFKKINDRYKNLNSTLSP